jgi:hypothetical protein
MKITTIFFILFLVYLPAIAQNSLPRSTPKAEKVSSQGILDFIDEVRIEQSRGAQHDGAETWKGNR